MRSSPGMAEISLGVYFLVCLLALIWPGYPWLGDRIEPYVLGVPFSLTWNVLWVAMSFLGLLAYHVFRRRRG